jgi:hypothetical protein
MTTRLTKTEVMLPQGVERKVDDLLVFDACYVDRATRYDLQRIIPHLVHLRRARKAYFEQHGCLMCPKPDPTIGIAARLRRRGLAWPEIYEITGTSTLSPLERKQFEKAVYYRLTHSDVAPRKPSHRYGAGGLCDKCYLRMRRKLSKAIKEMHEGRDAEAETSALTQRFDVAQWLLGDEASCGQQDYPKDRGRLSP